MSDSIILIAFTLLTAALLFLAARHDNARRKLLTPEERAIEDAEAPL